MYKRILVATDGSRLSRRAEEVALALAASMDAELIAFSAAPEGTRTLMLPPVAAAGIDPLKLDARLLEGARQAAQRVEDEARRRRIRARAVTPSVRSVAEAIVSQARKLRCDLIVMASHGRRGMQRVLLGSETQNVLAQADISVLVIR